VIVSRIREILRNDSDSSVQADAVEALGKLNASEAVNDIISALQGSPEVVRMTASQILGKFDISQVKAALRDTALNDPEYRPRLFAIKSLVELKDVEAISIFATLSTKDSDEHVRKAARDAYFRSKSWTK
jgi:HEAT repeat protein